MRIAVTGTPGTGKTSVARLLPYRVLDINVLIKDEGLHLGQDPDRGCLIADVDALEKRIDELEGAESDGDEVLVLEGHFSHQFAPVAIVLRTSPKVLKGRLRRRGYSEKKIRENLEAEALDAILIEAVEWCDQVHEIDTTKISAEETARLVTKIIRGEAKSPPGKIDWTIDIDWIGEMDIDPE